MHLTFIKLVANAIEVVVHDSFDIVRLHVLQLLQDLLLLLFTLVKV